MKPLFVIGIVMLLWLGYQASERGVFKGGKPNGAEEVEPVATPLPLVPERNQWKRAEFEILRGEVTKVLPEGYLILSSPREDYPELRQQSKPAQIEFEENRDYGPVLQADRGRLREARGNFASRNGYALLRDYPGTLKAGDRVRVAAAPLKNQYLAEDGRIWPTYTMKYHMPLY
jgi:hypothetical protein